MSGSNSNSNSNRNGSDTKKESDRAIQNNRNRQNFEGNASVEEKSDQFDKVYLDESSSLLNGNESGSRKWYNPGFPPAIYLIISNEFCERFTFYGLKAILTIYLLNGLKFDQSTSVVVYHVFIMFAYFTPVFGGIIADSWWGKYMTILLLSLVYVVGNCTTAFTSFESMDLLLKKIGCIVGLSLIAVGTGGIKPCVSAFGADQIEDNRPEVRSRFFSAFYFSVNFGSMLSTFITPYLRTVDCGGGSCFPLAFGVPAALMTVAIGFFVVGSSIYKRIQPKGNMIVDVARCCSRAVKNWWLYRKDYPQPAFLDYAVDGTYSEEFVANIRACKSIMLMLIPSVFFWALFDQYGSTWTLQAQKMDGSIGSAYVLPDQIQIMNPAIMLMMIPCFEAFVYPFFNKFKIFLPTRLLQRMIVGLFLCALAFAVAAVVQWKIQTQPNAYRDPALGNGWMRLVNVDPDCGMTANWDLGPKLNIDYLKVKDNLFNVPLTSSPLTLNISLSGNNCSSAGEHFNVSDLVINARKTRTVLLSRHSSISVAAPDAYSDSVGAARVMWANAPETMPNEASAIAIGCTAEDGRKGPQWTLSPVLTLQTQPNNSFSVIPKGTYQCSATVHYSSNTTSRSYQILGAFSGGVDSAAILVLKYDEKSDSFSIAEISELPAKTISVFWMIPQYFIITAGEILFSISGLNFAYSQAPASMRSVMLAYWYVTVAIGNLVVIIISESSFLPPAGMSLFYSVICFIDCIVFAIMCRFYKYRQESETSGDCIPPANAGSGHSPDRPPVCAEGFGDDRTGLPVKNFTNIDSLRYNSMKAHHQKKQHAAYYVRTGSLGPAHRTSRDN